MGTADTRRRGGRVLLPLALGIAAVLALGPVAAGAATVSAAWSAKIGSAGVNGKAAISAYTTGTGTITLKLAKLKPSTLLPVVIHKGTCSSVGAVLLKLPSIKTTRTGTAARTSSLTASQVAKITAATTAGTIAIRIGTVSARKCGLFSQLAVAPVVVGVNSATRTVTTGVFNIRWGLTNPEEILSLTWNGSANLTNSSPNVEYPCGGDSEFFGNSWGGSDGADYVSPVGWGTTGTWSAVDSGWVAITSSASGGCGGTSGIPVATSYQFFPQGMTQDQFLVQRKFSFGSTPFDRTFRPYIPRLHVGNFHTILHPDATGTRLVVIDDAGVCGYGCTVTDWNASWFALLDPESGSGMIVRHVPSSYRAVLWIDTDYYSLTTSSAVALVPPAGGFTGTVVENERLCFFDSSSWTPSLELPKGCQ